MELEEAIRHCREVAKSSSCIECAKEHEQLARWLEELKALKEQASGDCISRKAVIDALKQQTEEMSNWSERYTEQRKGILTAINIVNDLPSVNLQPETKQEDFEECIRRAVIVHAKKGHWIHDGGYWKNRWICSECGYKLFDVQSKFCPDCGARMEADK